MAYPNKVNQSAQSPAVIEKKPGKRLNDYTEINIGGIVYRVKSVFASKGRMGDLLDLAAMEKINRIA